MIHLVGTLVNVAEKSETMKELWVKIFKGGEKAKDTKGRKDIFKKGDNKGGGEKKS